MKTIEPLDSPEYADLEGARQAHAPDDNGTPDPDFASVPTEQETAQAQQSAKLRQILSDRAFDPSREPPPILPVFSLNGITISTAGNLTSITSTIKTGKSALIGAMMASAMNPMGENCDFLGVSSKNPDHLPLLHFDSEQPPSYYWHCVTKCLKRAGLEKPPPWFHSYCLTGLHWRQAKEVMLEGIALHLDPKRGLHSIFLDGLADFVSSVNEEAECNAFIQKLFDISIEANCPTIGVIHFNPGTDKTRGHLGSQFERKAETNLRLDKDENGVTVVWSEKQRLTPIPKKSGPAFSWSREAEMHTSVPNPSSSLQNVEFHDLFCTAQDLFSERPSMRYSDLCLTLQKLFKFSERSAKRKINRMVSCSVIVKSVAGLYTLGVCND